MNVPKCLDKLSPTWANILRDNEASQIVDHVFDEDGYSLDEERQWDNELPNDQKFDIDVFACCIVGECWLGNNKYQSKEDSCRCDTCTQFAMTFPERLGSIYEADCEDDSDEKLYFEGELEDNIQEFCDHIKEAHPNLVRDGDEDCELDTD